MIYFREYKCNGINSSLITEKNDTLNFFSEQYFRWYYVAHYLVHENASFKVSFIYRFIKIDLIYH